MICNNLYDTLINKKNIVPIEILLYNIINYVPSPINNKLELSLFTTEKEDPKINGSQIFGKVLYKVKSISYLNSVIGNLYGMYFAIFIPFGLIFFIEFIGYRKDKREE